MIGNAQFLTNQHLNQAANRDLALNLVGFLAEDQGQLALRPKEAASQPLLLQPWQAAILFWVPVVLLPLAFLVVGIVVIRGRRRPA